MVVAVSTSKKGDAFLDFGRKYPTNAGILARCGHPKRNCSGESHVITLLLQRTLSCIVSFGLSFCAACLHKIIPNSNKITEQILAEHSGTFRDPGSSRVERLDSP
jgi:hypothetical protein